MKFWRAYELGEPVDVMKLDDSDPPTPRANEIVIDVHAVGLNFPDILQCRGGYQVKPALPFAVGSEIAGVVSEVGDGVSGITLGDRVAGNVVGGLAEGGDARRQSVPVVGHDPGRQSGLPALELHDDVLRATRSRSDPGG